MTFLQLALICLVALAGPALSLARFAHLPVIIGELAVGLALGATGLGVLDAADHTFTLLADIGFALVMLVAGSQVPIRDPALRSGLRTGLLRAVLIGVVAAPVGVVIAAWFGTGHGALYAVLLTSSSAALIMPMLSPHQLGTAAIAQLLPQLAVADGVSIVLLPLAVDPPNAVQVAGGATLVIVAALVIFAFLSWAERSGRRKALHKLSEDRGLAVELRTSLTLLFAVAALAQQVRVSIMLAGFTFGLAMAAVGEPRRLAKQLFALTEGFFGPVFFVWLGASLDLKQLASYPSSIVLGLVLGVAAVAVHCVPMLTRQPWPVSVASAGQLGVPLAAAAVGTTLGVLKPGEDAALLLGAVVTIIAVTVSAGPLRRVSAAAADNVVGP